MAYAVGYAGSYMGRNIICIPQMEMQRNPYLSKCTVLQRDYASLGVFVFEDEYREAELRFQRDEQRRAIERQMQHMQQYAYIVRPGEVVKISSASTTSASPYYDYSSRVFVDEYGCEKSDSDEEVLSDWERRKKEANKPTKFERSFRKCYWARQLKLKNESKDNSNEDHKSLQIG